MSTTNSHWFASKLADKRLSQRQLAKLMGLDASAMSLMLRGKRKMDVKEAGEIARFLGVHVDEVLRHAGVAVTQRLEAGRVPVAGWVNEDRDVFMGAGLIGPSVVDAPPGLDDGVALRMQTDDAQDGWLLFYRPIEGVSLETVGRLCVVTLEDGSSAVRIVRRGYEPGTWSLAVYGAARRSESARLVSASPVLWMRM